MAINLIISNDMWNEKNHIPSVSAYDDVTLYALFDQPISHELEYIENDVTLFWITLSTNGEFISKLKANKVLNELMDEVKMFKNGKFKFSVCALPNALSQNYHAAFAQKMATMSAGTYKIDVNFETDNPLQKDKILAETSFDFELTDDAKSHLQNIAEQNIAQGADVEEDAEAKKAAFERINQPSEKFETTHLTLINKAFGDIWVMIGYNSENKLLVPYQKSITVSAKTGETLYRLEGDECTANYGQISKMHLNQSFEIY
jgi:hypothetical protein